VNTKYVLLFWQEILEIAVHTENTQDNTRDVTFEELWSQRPKASRERPRARYSVRGNQLEAE
jgi:hypothetical protein